MSFADFFSPAHMFQVIANFKSPKVRRQPSFQKETEVEEAKLPLLHDLSVSYLCLATTLASSHPLGKRRLDFTVKINYPAFLPKVLTVGSYGGSPRSLDLGARD